MYKDFRCLHCRVSEKKDAYRGTNKKYRCAQVCMYVHLCTAECFSIGEYAYTETDLLFLITLPPPPWVCSSDREKARKCTSQLVILGYDTDSALVLT